MKSIRALQLLTIITVLQYTRGDEKLSTARKDFAELAKEDTDFEPSDVSRVKSDGKWCEKFTLGANDEGDIVQAMIRTLKWRKSSGVKNFTDDYFPQEIYKIGFLVEIGKAKSGQPVLLIRLNRWRRVSPEFREIMKRFLVHQIEKYDKKNIRPIGINDWMGVTKDNIDLQLYTHIAIFSQQHYLYPNTMVFVPDMPSIVEATWKLVSIVFNEKLRERIKLGKSEDLLEHMDKGILPAHLGGTNNKISNPVPKSAKPLTALNFGSVTFTEEQVEKIRKSFEKELE